jgi:hypothetical protein
MIKFRFVGLDLSKISVVKIFGIFQLLILEYYDSASFIPDCKKLPSFIERNRGQHILFNNVLSILFSVSIYVNPIDSMLFELGATVAGHH